MSKITPKLLKKLKIPSILIPGLIVASILGFKGATLLKDYYQNKQLFPSSGYVQQVEDGDTFVLKNSRTIRLIGINSPENGQKNFDLAGVTLASMVDGKKLYLEYDRYQDDPYGRILAWVWVDCESTPKFLPADYMHLTDNTSRPGLTENPDGCKKGKLVNEELIKSGYAKIEVYKDRGPTKYEVRLSTLFSQSPRPPKIP